MAVLVFDLGGTLMEYRGMPASWITYYPQAFRQIATQYCPACTDADIRKSVEQLTAFNPRVSHREVEYAPETIFAACLAHWPARIAPSDAIDAFFYGIHLKPEIYPEVPSALQRLRDAGHRISTLTDLPTAMPDALFRRDIAPLLPLFDLYVSSSTCGFRKPNPEGLRQIAAHFSVNVHDLIFVGDEEKDRQTAERAGCAFYLIDRQNIHAGALRDLTTLYQEPLP